MRTGFEVKRSKVKVTWPINVETESVSPTNFKLRRWMVYAISTAMASYKGLWKLGFLHTGGNTVSAAPDMEPGHIL